MKVILLKRGKPGGAPIGPSEVPIPKAGPGELIIEMKACGLCGTDIEKLRGEYTAAMPILSHEAVGVVTSVGHSVSEFKKGDRVFPHHHVSCGRCHYCLRGNQTMCSDYKTSNIFPGGFSEFFRVPSWNVERGGVLKLPDSVGFEEATMIEPVACCIRALERCEADQEDSVLVVGAGPVGMAHALLLDRMGADVLISDVNEPRLRFAEKVGKAAVINATKQDVPETVRRSTGGRGADLAIVASGSQKAMAQALRSVRKGGRVCLFGIPVKGSKLDYDISDVYTSEVTITSSYGATDVETAKALELIASSRPDFRTLITHRFPLEKFGEGLEAALSGLGMKVVITPK